MIKKIILGVSVLTLFFSSAFFLNSRNQITNSVSATWTDNYDDINELTISSDIIIKGQLVSSNTQLRKDLVFTMNKVKVTEVISGDVAVGDIIDILQTGGTYKNITTQPIEDAPLLEKESSYLLYLSLTDKDKTYGQYYLISGGYQGITKVDKKENVTPATKNNRLFYNKNYDINDIENITTNVEEDN